MNFDREESSDRRRRTNAGQRSLRSRIPQRPMLILILIVIILALLTLGALFAWRSLGADVSGKSVANDTLASGPNPSIRVLHTRGTIRLEGVDNLESVELEVTKYAVASDKQRARRRASRVTTDLSKNDSTFVVETGGGRATGADYAIRVPIGSSVELESKAGDIEVVNLEGDVNVRAEAGDVTIKDIRGSVGAQVRQGDLLVSGVSTDTGQLNIDVGVGNASIKDIIVNTLNTRLETGDAVLSGNFSGSGRVRVRTGDILVRLSPEDAEELTLEARIGDVVRETDNLDGEE